MKRAQRALSFRTIHTEGGLLPSDLLQRIADEDRELPGLTPEAYHLDSGDRIRDAVNRGWTRLTAAWRSFQAALAKLPTTHSATADTRDKWLLPLFDVLGYGRLGKWTSQEIEGKTYPISHGWQSSPIHLLGSRVELDVRQKGIPGAAAVSPHGMVQDFLNRSDKHLWGFVSNGFALRILRDHHSLTQQAYVEFDLQAMMEGAEFSDFRVLWLLCHQSRIEAERPEDCTLEKWFQKARDEGVRALDKLRDGVERAIKHLGSGFLKQQKANQRLHDALRDNTLDKQEYYRQLLRLVYRLIFLFVAEDRGALLLPAKEDEPAEKTAARDRYLRFYASKRLRDLADKRRGGPHGDLWQAQRLVLHHLYEGAESLGLPALGSFLFRPSSTPDLNEAELANEDLLDALRALCYVDRGKARYAVNFRNVGAEELGSVYESLLELHPKIHRESAQFELHTAGGHERKTSGSYYTPRALVDCLLDSALVPVLDEAARKEDPEKAILDLKVCDPACGSGHFLVAAARRMALRLASVRSGGDEPSPPEVQKALRDVVGRCIYGVDLNPMAVELCKVSLWMEAVEPGKPLSFLEGHIREGNALLGATPALMERGIPDEAFEPIEGDDKEVARRLKKRNKEGRKGQMNLLADFARASGPVSYGRLSTGAAAIETDVDDTLSALRKKEGDWEQFTGSREYKDALFMANAWCASFFWPKQPGPMEDGAITQDVWERLRKDPEIVSKATRSEVRKLTHEYSFFHWHLAFPQVFRVDKEKCKQESENHGWSGGFDVMLGNPPWDTLSPDAKEFFSQYDPQIRFQAPEGQARLIAELTANSEISAKWAKTRRALFLEALFLKESGRYRLFAPGNLGKGDLNVYRMFVETALDSVGVGGMAAQVTPEGLYNGANCMAIRRALFDRFLLSRLFSFENARETWFKGIDSRTKFTIYAAKAGGRTAEFHAAFNLRSVPELSAASSGASLSIPVTMVEEFSPEALAIMEFKAQTEIDIATKMYAKWPKFGDETAGPPHRHYMREIDMGTDRELFSDQRDGLPLYEGRMVSQYDHRAKGYRAGRGRSADWEDLSFSDPEKAIQPQWHIPFSRMPHKVISRTSLYRLGFCDVASPTNERSLVAALLPPSCVSGDKVPTIVFRDGYEFAYLIWLAVANSHVMDFIVRKKISLKMSYTVLDSLPFPRAGLDFPPLQSLAPRVLRLTCTGPEMNAFWNRMAKHGWVSEVPQDGPPPGILDPEQRHAAIAEIEAIVANDIYGLARDELDYIMGTFPIVEKRDIQKYGSYRTKELVLAAYDQRVTPRQNDAN